MRRILRRVAALLMNCQSGMDKVEGQRENTGEIEALEGDKIEEGSTGEDEEQGQKMLRM